MKPMSPPALAWLLLTALTALTVAGPVACDVPSDGDEVLEPTSPGPITDGPTTSLTIPWVGIDNATLFPYLWDPEEHGVTTPDNPGAETLKYTHAVNLALDDQGFALLSLHTPQLAIRGCKRDVTWQNVIAADDSSVRCSPLRAYPLDAQTLAFEASAEGDMVLLVEGTVSAAEDPEFCDTPEERPITMTVTLRARTLADFRLDTPSCPNPNAAEYVAGETLVASPAHMSTFMSDNHIIPQDSDGEDFFPHNREPARPMTLTLQVEDGLTVDADSIAGGLPGLTVAGTGSLVVQGASGGDQRFTLVPPETVDHFEASVHHISRVSKTGQPFSPALQADGSYAPEHPWSAGLAFNITNITSDGVAMCTSPSIDHFEVHSKTPSVCSGGAEPKLLTDGTCSLVLRGPAFAAKAGVEHAWSAIFEGVAELDEPWGWHAHAHAFSL